MAFDLQKHLARLRGIHSGGEYQGWPHGGTGPYQTGPAQHRRFTEEVGNNPSQESLTRARYEDYDRAINEINNKGSISRLEDTLQFARGSAQQALRRSGMDPNSTAAVQLQTNAQGQAMDAAFRNEGELEQRNRELRAGHRGNIARMEQERSNALFQQYAMQRQMALQEKMFKEQQKAKRASGAMRLSVAGRSQVRF